MLSRRETKSTRYCLQFRQSIVSMFAFWLAKDKAASSSGVPQLRGQSEAPKWGESTRNRLPAKENAASVSLFRWFPRIAQYPSLGEIPLTIRGNPAPERGRNS